ncbi:MAG: DoxX family protein [Proteiniphilum sp.]|jgi:thiosulfate dehydrogenase [quinone] large subunit|nr:DoxX family protein [Proteiniphilum sp.]NCD14953.1 DoxX family protein [Bacteroidia bacterium]HHT35168.1 DoxX family protein [Bacteroidales bacterium]MDD2725830.1 DoxX family protein [Proteiniphilum sp.]MDD3331945.1 DoxX family protein [Proteiniphilum sp.]
MRSKRNDNYSTIQLYGLVILRVLIGWYFLYEGLAKVFTPKWTAYGYLMDSQGVFAPFFRMIAENQSMMAAADFINIWGLTLVGVMLILGLLEKASYIGAALFLILYYLSHPPLLHVEYLLPTEGSYLWVDKNLVMLAAVAVLYFFPTAMRIGMDRIMLKNKSK